MSYTVRITSVKPANVAWYTDVNQAAKDSMARYRTNAKAGANGMLNFQKTRPDANTIVRVYEFDTKENYDAFMSLTNSDPDAVARKNYNNQNGIVSTFTVV